MRNNSDAKRIIVTGGAGFIGSALVRYLVREKKHKVLNIDSLTYAGNLASVAPVSDDPNYTFLKADICDLRAMVDAIATFQPDHVMHLAAESHVDRSIAGADAFVQTNVVGTLNMLEAARSYWDGLDTAGKAQFRFLHVSTDEVYGSLGDDGLFTETTPYDPSSPYSASKAASDHLAKAWYRTYGFPVVVSNCSNNYGPYHFPEKLIPLNILNGIEGAPIRVYGDGKNIRDWLYVEDHVKALHLICSEGRLGETYNVGGHNERTNIEVVRRICEILDELCPKAYKHEDLITYVTDRPGHDKRYAIDSMKLRQELNWKAAETFDTGIRKTVQWYLENEGWWRPLRKQVYTGERLGVI